MIYIFSTPLAGCKTQMALIQAVMDIQVFFFCRRRCCSLIQLGVLCFVFFFIFAPTLHLAGLCNSPLNEHSTLTPSLSLASLPTPPPHTPQGASCNTVGLEQILQSPSPLHWLILAELASPSTLFFFFCLPLLSNLSLWWQGRPWAFCIEIIGLKAS